MFKKSLILLAIVLIIPTSVFAHSMMQDPYQVKSKQCEMIAKACKYKGYRGKAFWFGCMKPILYNQSVRGVKVHSKVVRACRDFKIKNLEQQLDELKKYQK